MTAGDYEKDLEANLDDLLSRIKSGRYFAPPVRRHHRYVINFRDWPLRRVARQAQASKTWTPGSADILSASGRRPEIVPAGTMPAPPEQPPLLGRTTGSESRPTSPETGREAMRTPANRDRDDEARDERGYQRR